MRSLVTLRRLALAAVAAGLCVPATASAAEQLVGLTADNQLLLFRSDSPSNLQGSVTVTGLATGETLLGIGYQDALGRIYALGSTNRLYVVSPITGAALPVSTTIDPRLPTCTATFDPAPRMTCTLPCTGIVRNAVASLRDAELL